jgi:tripartite-type tricarboxylate transporter receptor subunit TctC
MSHRMIRAALVTCGVGLVSLAWIARSQSSAEELYAGKVINIVIGYGVGGGYDLNARLLGRHMGRHLPGHPAFAPQNMPGAGALKAANYIYFVAPKDGTVIGTFAQPLLLAQLIGTATYDARKFSLIGSVMKEALTCVFSARSPISSWEDMLAKEHTLGGQARGVQMDAFAATLRSLFNTRTKLVTGYNGQREIMLAIERGEVDGVCGQSYEALISVYANLLSEHKLKIVLQASRKSWPALQGIPNLFDLAATDEQKGILDLVLGATTMSRIIVAPPGVPTEKIQVLRNAFDATMKDPEFLAEARRLNLDVSPLSGAEIDKSLAEIYAAPKELIRKAVAISELR